MTIYNRSAAAMALQINEPVTASANDHGSKT